VTAGTDAWPKAAAQTATAIDREFTDTLAPQDLGRERRPIRNESSASPPPAIDDLHDTIPGEKAAAKLVMPCGTKSK